MGTEDGLSSGAAPAPGARRALLSGAAGRREQDYQAIQPQDVAGSAPGCSMPRANSRAAPTKPAGNPTSQFPRLRPAPGCWERPRGDQNRGLGLRDEAVGGAGSSGGRQSGPARRHRARRGCWRLRRRRLLAGYLASTSCSRRCSIVRRRAWNFMVSLIISLCSSSFNFSIKLSSTGISNLMY